MIETIFSLHYNTCMKCFRYLVSGRVQGVFFRQHTMNTARALELKGTVRNLSDGKVEVVVQGNDLQLGELEAFLNQGPVLAKVTQVNKEEIQLKEPFSDFRVIH